jgi:hypothetical protein
MSALPRRFYGNPVDCVDEMRKISRAAEIQAARDRLHKSRRIRALLKEAMKGVRR